jgi:phosphodiesterase/alkaline phosphatase D-like protein
MAYGGHALYGRTSLPSGSRRGGGFRPVWEFISGPLNAGAFGPNKLDPTIGPEALFVHAPPAANTISAS